MKLQLDFSKKVITIENSVNLNDFFKKIKNILPDWKDWKMDTNTNIVWSNPIYIDRWHDYPYNPITYTTSNIDTIFQIEC